MRQILGPILGSGLFAVIATVSAQADAAPLTTPIESLVLSRAMFDQGQARGDVWMILGAAALRRSVPLDPVTGTGEAQVLGWEAMLDAAGPLAAGDPLIAGLIADLRAQRSRGVSTGALFRNASLDAGGATEFEAIAFEAGQAAEVYVEGVAAADLNLFVYDEAKALVCADEDTSYIAHCYWEPDVPGRYVIKVVNLGAIPSNYALITN